jgi:hypothetical protein
MEIEYDKGRQNFTKRKREAEPQIKSNNKAMTNQGKGKQVQIEAPPSICQQCKKNHGNRPCPQGQNVCFNCWNPRHSAQSCPKGNQETKSLI